MVFYNSFISCLEVATILSTYRKLNRKWVNSGDKSLSKTWAFLLNWTYVPLNRIPVFR